MKRLLSSFFITLGLGLILYFGYEWIKKDRDDSHNNEEIKYIFDNSFMNIVEVSNLENIIDNNEDVILLIGNESSNSTAKVTTYLKELKTDYNLEVYYLEINDDIKANFNYTNFINKYELGNDAYFEPILMVFKNHKYVMGYPGDGSYRNLKSFLEYTQIIRSDSNE